MAEFVVLILRQTADAAGRATGLSIAAVKVSSDAATPQTVPIAASTAPFFMTEFGLQDAAMIVLPGGSEMGAIPLLAAMATPQVCADNSAVAGSAVADVPTLPNFTQNTRVPEEQPSPPPRRPMPGWLAAHAHRQAVLAGRVSRPLSRASSRRPRPGNRPARRIEAPRHSPKSTVVWMAAR